MIINAAFCNTRVMRLIAHGWVVQASKGEAHGSPLPYPLKARLGGLGRASTAFIEEKETERGILFNCIVSPFSIGHNEIHRPLPSQSCWPKICPFCMHILTETVMLFSVEGEWFFSLKKTSNPSVSPHQLCCLKIAPVDRFA